MNDPHRNDDGKMSSSSSSNYSDLLPLVATVLNDKVAADAHDEINSLRRRNALLSSVNIIQQRSNSSNVDNINDDGDDDAHDDGVAIASAQFQNGWFDDNYNWWRVEFNSSPPFSCRLADLKSCYVNVGGGFPVADFGANFFDGRWDYSRSAVTSMIEKYDGDNTKLADFSMGDGVCGVRVSLGIAVHGWPREDWEETLRIHDDLDDHGELIVDYLVEEVANKFPDATIEFIDVNFLISTMRGALRKLIPDRRTLEVVAERDGRASLEAGGASINGTTNTAR